jgi:hypothetical protein
VRCRSGVVGDDHTLVARTGRRIETATKELQVKYLILMHVDPAVLEGLTADQQSQMMTGHQDFIKSTKDSGEFLATSALADPAQSATVRARNGAPEVTDGPYAESKEYMGGYYLIDVESRERAIELAIQIPDASIDGLGLEVRPVMFSDGADM